MNTNGYKMLNFNVILLIIIIIVSTEHKSLKLLKNYSNNINFLRDIDSDEQVNLYSRIKRQGKVIDTSSSVLSDEEIQKTNSTQKNMPPNTTNSNITGSIKFPTNDFIKGPAGKIRAKRLVKEKKGFRFGARYPLPGYNYGYGYNYNYGYPNQLYYNATYPYGTPYGYGYAYPYYINTPRPIIIPNMNTGTFPNGAILPNGAIQINDLNTLLSLLRFGSNSSTINTLSPTPGIISTGIPSSLPQNTINFGK